MLPNFQRYEGWNRRQAREIEQMTRMAANQGDGRFYYARTAQAFLLDCLLPSWKPLALGSEVVWLEGLLAEALHAG